jgi:PilZ domain
VRSKRGIREVCGPLKRRSGCAELRMPRSGVTDSVCSGWTKSFFAGNMEQMSIIRWLKTTLSPQPRRSAEGVESSPNVLPRAEGAPATDPSREKAGPAPEYGAKRRYERFAVEGKNLKARAALTEVIELSNVSIGGACIITTRTLRPGDNILLRIPSEKVEKPLKCTIVWEAVSDKPLDRDGAHIPAYKAGVKFDDVPSGTIVRLKDFMRSAGVPEEGNRDEGHEPSALRFSVLLSEKALMNCSATFPVKKISLGGMLIETASELEIDGRYPAALYLPGDDRPLRFNGRVASKVPSDGGFDVGIEFCDMSDDARSRLAVFIGTLHASR